MTKKRKDYDYAVVMYDDGLSIQDVAEFYGITRQSMHKILQRRGVSFRPQIRTGKQNVFYRGGCTQDMRAHQIFSLAVEKGILVNPGACSECASEKRVEGHHDDYSRPLDVRWLCHKCHYEWHIANTPMQCDEDYHPPKMARKQICSMGGRASQRKRRLNE